MTIRLTLCTLTLLVAAGCIPSRVKELNRMGQDAFVARRYERAISNFTESLKVYPNQPKVVLQLGSAKIMLKQIYVDRIYELLDGPEQPVQSWVEVFRVASELPKLDVPSARIATIRIDLDERFAKREPRLRAQTEPHRYYLHLGQMLQLVRVAAVERSINEVGELLRAAHVRARDQADQAQRPGLALLHTAAAATFSSGDTGLWADARRRENALRDTLGIRVALGAQSAAGGAPTSYLIGGVKRRLPRIFVVTDDAALKLEVRADQPHAEQHEVSDRLSGRCQVDVRREPNPAHNSLKRQVELAHRTHEQKLAALQAAQSNCAASAQATTCASQFASATQDVQTSERHYGSLERELRQCPETIEEPVYKIFFYQRVLVTRSAQASGTVTIMRGTQVLQSRAIHGSATAQDSYSDGLSCAQIAPDPLELATPAVLLRAAQERLLDQCPRDLLHIQRQLAEQQLAGGDTLDQRLDALVRARLVDESYELPQRELEAHLTHMWETDWKLAQRLVQ